MIVRVLGMVHWSMIVVNRRESAKQVFVML